MIARITGWLLRMLELSYYAHLGQKLYRIQKLRFLMLVSCHAKIVSSFLYLPRCIHLSSSVCLAKKWAIF